MNHYCIISALFLVLVLSSLTTFSYAQRLGNADVLLSDIYLNPANPKEGDLVSIQSIVYNAGLESTKSVTDVVTVGYFVNGDLVKIAELPNVEPGVENGILLSSGPIWTVSEGSHTITVILNYHDTLSHLIDNPSNNIVQKIFSIGEPRPSLVNFDVFQEYLPQTKMQQITIEGSLTSLSDKPFLPDQIILQIGDSLYDVIPLDQEGLFSFSKNIPSFDEVIPITITVEENYPLLGSTYTANIYPIQMSNNDSVLAIQIQDPEEFYNFKDSSAVLAIYDESYNLIKKISTDNLSFEKTYDTVFTTLASGGYIVEVYIEGRFVDAIQTNLKENSVKTISILIPETSKVKFQILDNNGEPINNAVVQNWIFTINTDETGFTEWINIFPTLGEREPYTAKIILPNGKISWSDSFFIKYGDQKIIQVVTEP